jgi:hypothetical protein
MTAEHALGPRNRAVLQALCDHLFEPGRDDRTTPADVGVASAMSRSLALAPDGMSRGIRLLLVVFNWLPLLVIGRPGRFVRMSHELQHRYVEALLNHWFRPLRVAAIGVKLMAAMHYWHDLKVLGELGYQGMELIDEEVALSDAPVEQVAG